MVTIVVTFIYYEDLTYNQEDLTRTFWYGSTKEYSLRQTLQGE